MVLPRYKSGLQKLIHADLYFYCRQFLFSGPIFIFISGKLLLSIVLRCGVFMKIYGYVNWNSAAVSQIGICNYENVSFGFRHMRVKHIYRLLLLIKLVNCIEPCVCRFFMRDSLIKIVFQILNLWFWELVGISTFDPQLYKASLERVRKFRNWKCKSHQK